MQKLGDNSVKESKLGQKRGTDTKKTHMVNHFKRIPTSVKRDAPAHQ